MKSAINDASAHETSRFASVPTGAFRLKSIAHLAWLHQRGRRGEIGTPPASAQLDGRKDLTDFSAWRRLSPRFHASSHFLPRVDDGDTGAIRRSKYLRSILRALADEAYIDGGMLRLIHSARPRRDGIGACIRHSAARLCRQFLIQHDALTIRAKAAPVMAE